MGSWRVAGQFLFGAVLAVAGTILSMRFLRGWLRVAFGDPLLAALLVPFIWPA